MRARTSRFTGVGVFLLGGMALAADAPSGWTQVQTAHVTVKTNLVPAEAQRAALAAERLRTAMLAAAWPGAKLLQPERVDLVVLANRVDFVGLFGEVTGTILEGVYPPTIFLFGPPEKWESRETQELQETNSVLKQGLAAHLASFFYQRQPRWFLIGLAQFLETMRLSADGKTATLGDLNLQAVREYNTNRTTTVEDALRWGKTLNPQDEATLSGLYGLSWLMVHFLYNLHPEAFARFQTLLAKGVDPDKAYNLAFPELSPGSFDKELNHFAHYGEYRNTSVSVPEGDTTLRGRPMTLAEVHTTLATAALAAEKGKEAAEENAAALAADPGNVPALRQRLSLVSRAERLSLGRRATAAHPEEGLAWLTLADALRGAPENWDECAQAYRKATELLPGHPAAFAALAWMELQQGKPSEALPLALAAGRLAPWDSAILDTLAATLAAVGRCSEAVPTQSRALDLLSEGATEALRGDYVARLARMRRRCAVPVALGPPPPSPPLNEAPPPGELPVGKP